MPREVVRSGAVRAIGALVAMTACAGAPIRAVEPVAIVPAPEPPPFEARTEPEPLPEPPPEPVAVVEIAPDPDWPPEGLRLRAPSETRLVDVLRCEHVWLGGGERRLVCVAWWRAFQDDDGVWRIAVPLPLELTDDDETLERWRRHRRGTAGALVPGLCVWVERLPYHLRHAEDATDAWDWDRALVPDVRGRSGWPALVACAP